MKTKDLNHGKPLQVKDNFIEEEDGKRNFISFLKLIIDNFCK